MVKKFGKCFISYLCKPKQTLETMKIDDLKVAKLIYTIQCDTPNGQILEQATPEKPRVMMFGVGRIMKSFSDALRGLEAGASFVFTIPPEEAFGLPDPENQHPLAGHALFVRGEVLEVRDPTIEEMNAEVEWRRANGLHFHHDHEHEHHHHH